jgi:hypothetical protein
MEWEIFFPPATPVCALPDWKSPQLYFPADTPARRLKSADFFQGWRLSGRVRRAVMKLKATVKPGEIRWCRHVRWALEDFAKDVFPDIEWVVLMSNPRNFSDKVVARCFNGDGSIIGYVKYGESGVARRRLENEYSVLGAIPPGLGPPALKLGDFSIGTALCLGALEGRAMPLVDYPGPEARAFLDRLPESLPVSFDRHPWPAEMRRRHGPGIDQWLAALTPLAWPVKFQHGDFAPWNLMQCDDGSVRAFDWEYGCVHGFPWYDSIYYLLQTSILGRRLGPAAALKAVTTGIESMPGADTLTPASIRALIGLTACEQYATSLEDGHNPRTRIQKCRLAIWNGTV